ncbi:MAG: hypothetical protein AVDCRST_MAG77-4393 [uncultured Chloroflexi bacterium]|uniref:ABC transporter, substrate-binding protein (Cluster 1, maltose/g3p/polyamine/iron) n=1 Tax=uncultured Chloroflexota bacterium TaxID=166587 RepID=A0A6J4JTU5_9CHLR|nr:MAG: hypothetical protein AVDCRST_MAG77-4393 [uncultured Chloroflexota bacterium]
MREQFLSRRRLLAAGAALTTTISACAAPSGGTGGPELAGRRAEPVSLTYWKSLSGPRHEAQARLVEAFNAQRGDVRVSMEHVGEYGPAADKLRLALAGGTPPDVMLLGANTEMPYFARLGVLQELDGFARGAGGARGDALDGLYPGFVRDSRFACTGTSSGAGSAAGTGDACPHPDGALHQLPFARSTPLLYANLDLLRSAGLPETLPATWPDFLETAQHLLHHTRRSGAEDSALSTVHSALAYGAGNSWWEFQSALWAFGGAFSDARRVARIGEPASVRAVQFLADLVHRHRVALATKNAPAEFLRGNIAFLTTSTANLTQLVDGASFRVGVAPPPGMSGREAAVPGGGAGLSILRPVARRAREKAWELLTFMTSTESTAFFAQATGYTPVRPAAMESPALSGFLERYPAARVALAQQDRVRTADAVLAAPGVNTLIQDALQAVLFEGAAVPATCDALATALKRAAEQS